MKQKLVLFLTLGVILVAGLIAFPSTKVHAAMPYSCTKTLLRSNSQLVFGTPGNGLRVNVFLYASTICGDYEASMQLCTDGDFAYAAHPSYVFLQDINQNAIRSNSNYFGLLGPNSCDAVLNTAIDGYAPEVRAVGILGGYSQVNSAYFP